MSSTNVYHTLQRTWPSRETPSGQAQQRQSNPVNTAAKFGLERWAGESMKEQPWNGIGQFAEQRETDRRHKGGEEGTSGGEAGSGAKSDA